MPLTNMVQILYYGGRLLVGTTEPPRLGRFRASLHETEMMMETSGFATRSWELKLQRLANSALARPMVDAGPLAEGQQLGEAYERTAEITAFHSRSFHLASALLPREKRRAARALYAFCRVTDDIVDGPGPDRGAALDAWRERALAARPPREDLVAQAWADARHRYGIPLGFAEQLISGIGMDLRINRYPSFETLTEYAYSVASTVGLMSMYIVGFSDSHAVPYALKMGVALQLTNILRDVGEDWRSGRLYLPQDELAAFGIDESDIAAGHVTEQWKEYARFYVDRNHRLYEEAWPGIGMLSPDGRFAIGAAAELYRGILNQIERNGYDVFSQRAHLGKLSKLSRLPGIWVKSVGASNVLKNGVNGSTGFAGRERMKVLE